MPTTPSGARVTLAAEGSVNVATGLSVLDHLVGELARAGRFKIAREVAPDKTDEAVPAAGAALGRAIARSVATLWSSGSVSVSTSTSSPPLLL